MTEDEVRQICEMRLDRWSKHLVAELATPLVVVGVRHDQSQGQVILCLIHDISAIEVAAILAGAAKMVQEMPQATVDYWAERLKAHTRYLYSLNYQAGGPHGTGAIFRGWKVVKEEINPPTIMDDIQGQWLEAIYAAE